MRPQACAAPDIVTTGMRNTMNNLLQTYVKNENFDNIISDFYDEVKLSDLVKHYFLAAKKPGLIRDLKKYHVYLLPKSELEFNQRPTSSSLFDIQLPGNQFQEVTEILVKVLKVFTKVFRFIFFSAVIVYVLKNLSLNNKRIIKYFYSFIIFFVFIDIIYQYTFNVNLFVYEPGMCEKGYCLCYQVFFG